MPSHSLENFQKLAKDRDIYLWGARQLGVSAASSLRRQGFEPAGFLDSSPDIQGSRQMDLTVLAPAEIINRPRGSFFILICSSFFLKEISSACLAVGLEEGRDFMAATDLQKCSWFVDISGSCNLKCISCPRGNWPKQPRPGFMKVDLYARVVDKILSEDPFTGAVNLYTWGEPLLHPHLAEIVRLTNEKGLQAAISSNLCLPLDFEETIKAKPAYFRVSASGWGENYEQTHTGGKWDLFLKNLRRLSELHQLHHPEMIVEMNYHIYRDRGDDYLRMRALCEELGIVFRAGHGRLHPLDNISRLRKNLEISPQARKTITLQSLPIEDGLKLLDSVEDTPCPYEVIMDVAWDGRVNHCLGWFDPDIPTLTKNFLETPLDSILKDRLDNDFCRSCQKNYLHRWCNVYGDESLTDETSPEVKAAHAAA